MLDQVEMQTIIEPGWNERAQEIVRLFDRGAFRNPAQPPRDAKNMRVDGKRRKYGLQLYGIWWTRLEIWSNRLDRWTPLCS